MLNSPMGGLEGNGDVAREGGGGERDEERVEQRGSGKTRGRSSSAFAKKTQQSGFGVSASIDPHLNPKMTSAHPQTRCQSVHSQSV